MREIERFHTIHISGWKRKHGTKQAKANGLHPSTTFHFIHFYSLHLLYFSKPHQRKLKRVARKKRVTIFVWYPPHSHLSPEEIVMMLLMMMMRMKMMMMMMYLSFSLLLFFLSPLGTHFIHTDEEDDDVDEDETRVRKDWKATHTILCYTCIIHIILY